MAKNFMKIDNAHVDVLINDFNGFVYDYLSEDEKESVEKHIYNLKSSGLDSENISDEDYYFSFIELEDILQKNLYKDEGNSEKVLDEIKHDLGLDSKENKHYKDRMNDIKNNDYYKELLLEYRTRGENSLTTKQLDIAKKVDKVLSRSNKNPIYFDNYITCKWGYAINQKDQEQKQIHKRINRRAVQERLNEYRNLSGEDAIEVSLDKEDSIISENKNHRGQFYNYD